MSSAGTTSSISKNKGEAFIVSPTPSRRYSSPPPGASTPSGNSCCSPPPPPSYFTKSVGESEPASVVESEINSGQSILNKCVPVDISKMFLSPRRKSPFLECEAEKRSVRPRTSPPTNIDSGLVLVSPPYPYFPSTPSRSKGDLSEDEDEDMPSMPSPINLSMRCTSARSPIAPRVPVAGFLQHNAIRPDAGFLRHNFVPIKPTNDGD